MVEEKNIENIRVVEIKNDGFYKLMKNDLSFEEFYIFREYSNIELKNKTYILKTEIERENIIYNSYIFIPSENKFYEAIIFSKEIDFSLIKKIYEFIIENQIDLNTALNKINNLLLDINSIITIHHIRGAFAEMKIILDYGFKCSQNRYSIFDSNNEKNDIEIKSFSKTKRTVEISYQQLVNSINTLFYFVEVFESSEGESIFDLYDQLNIDEKKRFAWIQKLKKTDWNSKFLKGEVIIKDVEYLKENLNLPSNAIDAKFIYLIK